MGNFTPGLGGLRKGRMRLLKKKQRRLFEKIQAAAAINVGPQNERLLAFPTVFLCPSQRPLIILFPKIQPMPEPIVGILAGLWEILPLKHSKRKALGATVIGDDQGLV
jgi:hypothetical protein